MKFLLSLFVFSFGVALASAQGSSQAALDSEQPVLVAMASVNGLPMELSTSCEKGTAIFKVVNVGEALPSSIIFNIVRVNVDQVVSKRRMNLSPGQTATFKLKNADKIAGEIGLFMDAQWLPRERQIDASVQCSA